MKTYKVLHAVYKGVENDTIILPENTKLLYHKDDIGSGLRQGFNHYLACFRKNEFTEEELEEIFSKYFVTDYDFGDLLFVVYDNIQFVEETPEFYIPQEFMDEFEINKYYINYSCIELKDNADIFNMTGDEIVEYIERHTILCSMVRITDIIGPYSLTTFEVDNYIPSIHQEFYNIEENTSDLHKLLFPRKTHIKVIKNDEAKFQQMIQNVLNRNV
jgi:hypothetical protein